MPRQCAIRRTGEAFHRAFAQVQQTEGSGWVMALMFGIRRILAGRPAKLGAVDGRLALCPATPNCVCTLDSDPRHAIEALEFAGTPRGAMERLRKIVEAQPRCRIIRTDLEYLHAEFTSRLLGFVDDVEFLVQARQQRIDFRSASRLGRSDFGVNRRRMESIRQAWIAAS